MLWGSMSNILKCEMVTCASVPQPSDPLPPDLRPPPSHFVQQGFLLRRGSYGGTAAQRIGLKATHSVHMKTLPSDGRRR